MRAYNRQSQFHYGSITTILRNIKITISIEVSIPLWFDYNRVRLNEKQKLALGLNSTMVRLQLLNVRRSALLRTEKVSIPLWFDYNKRVSEQL